MHPLFFPYVPDEKREGFFSIRVSKSRELGKNDFSSCQLWRIGHESIQFIAGQ